MLTSIYMNLNIILQVSSVGFVKRSLVIRIVVVRYVHYVNWKC